MNPDAIAVGGFVVLFVLMLLRVPVGLLEGMAALAGQGERMRRLTRSLEIDASETEAELGWAPQIGLATALDDMVRAYREAS